MKTLDYTERQVLLRKYMHKYQIGFWEAKDRVNKFHDYLKDLRDKLKIKGKTPEDIDIKFKQEFEKMCMKLER